MGPGPDARDLLTGMYQHAPDAMSLVRMLEDGRLIYESVNPAWERATGVPASEAMGRSPQQIFAPEVAARIEANRRRCIEEGTAVTVEEDLIFPAGRSRWQTHLVPVGGERVAIFARDISARKDAEDALRDAEARWRTLAQSAPIHIFTLDREGRILSINRRYGPLEENELVGIRAADLCDPEFRADVEKAIQSVFRKRRTARIEVRARPPGGTASWFDCTLGPLMRGRTVTTAIGTATDISKRKTAEQALGQRERRFRALYEHSWDGVALLDAAGNILSTTPAITRLLGYQPSEFVGPVFGYMHPQDAPRMLELISALAATPAGRITAKCRMRNTGGGWRWFEVAISNLLHEPSVVALVANFRDITERQRGEEAALALDQAVSCVTGQAFFQSLVRHFSRILGMAHVRVVELDGPQPRRGRTVAVWEDGRLLENFDYDVAGTPCERTMTEGISCFPDGIRSRYPGQPAFEQVDAESYLGIALRACSGETIGFIALIDRKPLEDSGFAESLLRLVAPRVAAELERERAEQALRESEQRLRAVMEQAPVILWTTDAELRIRSSLGAGLKALGLGPGERNGVQVDEVIRARDPLHVALDWHHRAVAGETVSGEVEWAGHLYEAVVQPFRDREGRIVGCLGVAVDITERRQLQEELRQSQKMEAVGRLAGGIAHDFNNLLTVISGYSSFLLEGLPEGGALRSYAEQVWQAATRAAQLTAQLLAFGRKQMLQPRIIDVNHLIRDAGTMLRPLIGENVALQTDLQSNIGCIMADPGQIYQVVVNLAVNGRDAMPKGGELTISTADVTVEEGAARGELKPGAYVMIAVSDSGHGMDHDVLAHLFEPFFTTKEVGKGTGLGLSTAYGIVKQSGGHIEAESEVGRGSTFRVFLPRIDGPPEGETAAQLETAHGIETVLLVEDEELVRDFARSALEQAGYKVLEAANGREALRLIQDHAGKVDLLLTDLVMPEMGGRELAEQAGRHQPGLPVLYVTGYAAETDSLPAGAACLHKPFRREELAAQVRAALDRAPNR